MKLRTVAADVVVIAELSIIYALLYVASYVDAGFRLFTRKNPFGGDL